MASALKVVALISGGKDSLFSILHCMSNEHEIVALANLTPSETFDTSDTENEDIDSFMYQTVGSSVIPLYEDALGIPLYREYIKGSAVDTALTYDPATFKRACHGSPEESDDEVESITRLLRRIVSLHPTINAVSTGAILSTYQRTRIESVALRLGLTPLAYLWQYPYLPPHEKASLLKDMAAVGQDSRIIKVASSGLDERHLWLTVNSDQSIAKLTRDMGRFGYNIGDVLGEGGEYETITLDGPEPLWKKRIEVHEQDRKITRTSGGSWALKVSRDVRLVEKARADAILSPIRIPELFDRQFCELVETHHMLDGMQEVEPTTTQRCASSKSSVTVEQLNTLLSDTFATMDDHHSIIFVMILLRDLSHFGAVNKAYNKWFQAPNPPARVTLACGDKLPEGVNMVLYTTQHLKKDVQQGLHVQSRSYWAPANIGPYSQAITVTSADGDASVVYIAGQIPLIPASMELLGPLTSEHGLLFLRQSVLSLQHLWRVGRATSVQAWSDAIAFVTGQTRDQVQRRAEIANKVWTAANTAVRDKDDDAEESEEDIADLALRRNPWSMLQFPSQDGARVRKQSTLATIARFPISEHVTFGAGFAGSISTPPCAVVQIQELPRSAPIEWYSTGISGSVKYDIEMMQGSSNIVRFCGIAGARTRFFYATVSSAEMLAPLLEFVHNSDRNSKRVWTEVYTAHRGAILTGLISSWGLRLIDCKTVWDSDSQEVFAVIRGMLRF